MSTQIPELPADGMLALLELARGARAQAHCPYSGYAVGAAVLWGDGSAAAGCNVENVSYGLTVCAERNAVATAVAGGMRPGKLSAVAVVAGDREESLGELATVTVRPCGACLQVLAEFAAPDCIVLCAAPEGEPEVMLLRELLPQAFARGGQP